MIKYLLKTIQRRIMCMLFVFFIVTLGTSFYTITSISQQAINKEKGAKLLSIAAYLDEQLGAITYDDILRSEHAQNATRKEKIAVLHRVLKDRTDSIAHMSQGLGVGYYSLELDAILTYGPSPQFNDIIGVSIAPNHPGRTVMEENTGQIKIGSMVRGNIMNAMNPVERNGKVIGYTWANELTSTIESEYRAFINQIFIFLFIFFLITIVIAMYFSHRLTRDLDTIVDGVKKMRNDLTVRVRDVGGELQEVADNINNMAEHIEKTAREHEALLLAEAANLAQREFLSRMSHELRTPMNGVLGMTTLAMQAQSDDQRMGYLKKIQSSATLLLGIINDILDFSKIEANKMDLKVHPFDLRQSIENMLQLIKPRAEEKSLELQITVDNNVPQMVVGDELKLSQILLNLLGNAVKFTDQGQISLTVFSSTTEEGRHRLECSVKDSGIGMNQEQLDGLFTPFSQGDSSTIRKYEGTGLGLAISKALIQLMDGEITVRSQFHAGSTFEFYIYLDAFTLQHMAEPETEESLCRSYEGVRALLAEDVEINQEIAVALLSGLGIVSDVAKNGAVAVELYKKNQYDLIFMDIRMPSMDGLEATRIIRALEAESGSGAHIPIIAMTANAMREDKESSSEAGMDAHVSKPINIEEICRALGQVLSRI